MANSISLARLLDTYGSFNDLREQDGLSGDRRSMTTTNALSAILEKAYTPDVLSGKSLFTGLVMATIPSDQPLFFSMKDNLEYVSYLRNQYSRSGQADLDVSQLYLTYKVLIPEIDPRVCLAPTNNTTGMTLSQRVNTLPDAVIASIGGIDHAEQFIKPGTLVDIIFDNQQRHLGAKIVKVGAQVFDIDFNTQSIRSAFDRPPGLLTDFAETNPGVERVVKASSRVSWGSNPLMQEFLEVIDAAAANEGIYLTVSSAVRTPHDQARIMLSNYQRPAPKGGRKYLIELYGQRVGKAAADIFDTPELNREQKIQAAIREIPYMSKSSHGGGTALDFIWGYTTDGKVATNKPVPSPQVTRVLATAIKKMSVSVLLESDHYHLKILSSRPGNSKVVYDESSSPSQQEAAANSGLASGAVRSVEV